MRWLLGLLLVLPGAAQASPITWSLDYQVSGTPLTTPGPWLNLTATEATGGAWLLWAIGDLPDDAVVTQLAVGGATWAGSWLEGQTVLLWWTGLFADLRHASAWAWIDWDCRYCPPDGAEGPEHGKPKPEVCTALVTGRPERRVPEPSVLLLGLAGVWWWRRRARHSMSE